MRRGIPRTWGIAAGAVLCATAFFGGQAEATPAASVESAKPVSPAELEVDVATQGSPSGDVSYKCVTTPNAKVCFQPYGDYLFAYDRKKDGYSATVDWDIPGTRQGQCINKLGAGNWGYCNKDFPENRQITITAWYNGEPYSTSLLT